MRLCLLCAVDEFEEHGVGDVQLGELVEGRGGQVDLAAVDDVLTVGLHEDWVAAVVLVEAARAAASRQQALVVHGEGVVAVLRATLVVCSDTLSAGGRHTMVAMVLVVSTESEDGCFGVFVL